jgi:hypothetical protein
VVFLLPPHQAWQVYHRKPVFVRASCDSFHAVHSSRRNMLYYLHWVVEVARIPCGCWPGSVMLVYLTLKIHSLNQPYMHWNMNTVDIQSRTCFSTFWVPHQGTPLWLQSKWWHLRSVKTCRRLCIMFTFQCV